jgi:hypothetical protein
LCGKIWKSGSRPNCNCAKISQHLNDIAVDSLATRGLTNNFVPSPCFGCDSMKKFVNGIKSLGFSSLEVFLANSSNYTVIFHGTSTIDGASKICCESWNPAMRGTNGQAHGVGEYFAKQIATPLQYASVAGAIIVTLCVSRTKCEGAIHEAAVSGTDAYVIVNNPADRFDQMYCLPLGVLQSIANTKSCKICKRVTVAKLNHASKNIIEDIMAKKVQVGYTSDTNEFAKYSDYSMDIVRSEIAKGNIKAIRFIAPNGMTYSLNLTTMMQTNESTTHTRVVIVA